MAADSYLEFGPIIGSVMLVYDWCHDRLTPAQRSRWVAYANQAVWNVWHPDQARWGNTVYAWSWWSIDNPSNNYYYSFLRATMLVGRRATGRTHRPRPASTSSAPSSSRTSSFPPIGSLRSVIDVMDEIGIEAYISERSSRTCEFAVRLSGPRVINREEIEKIFQETVRGDFAARWMTEWQLGMFHLHRMRRTWKKSMMEQVGQEWRQLFGKG